jgi:hypothetical protein
MKSRKQRVDVADHGGEIFISFTRSRKLSMPGWISTHLALTDCGIAFASWRSSKSVASPERKLLRFANDQAKAIAEIRPTFPAGFNNRVRANWKLVLAGDWPERSRKADKHIVGRAEGSQGAKLSLMTSARGRNMALSNLSLSLRPHGMKAAAFGHARSRRHSVGGSGALGQTWKRKLFSWDDRTVCAGADKS